ncbi:MAG: aldo/keto reductase [Candidatus Auribacter fodinae]|uniref:Aldo/keto reductase n=1 Tax=Candidatus Auribacter fodinae TaxID=2093366 RepID=A0A3A4R1M7_9BACT|nr:MAG: aldo/keto reductase [Candidatus Auribacter fodinae]
MEIRTLGSSMLKVTPIGLGTWVMGGWMWGGAEEQDGIDAIKISVERGITLIDTAPVYGFGKSETIVGKALKELGCREKIILATKCGLEWDDNERVRRNCGKQRILQEINDSLRRLQTDYIDLYQVHWPDKYTPFEETMGAMRELYDAGKIRAIGVSNYSVEQIEASAQFAPLHTLQPPFNLFEQDTAKELLPYCVKHTIGTLTYSTLCSGLLTGKFTAKSQFSKGDLRKSDPKFKGERFQMYLKAVDALKKFAQSKGSTVGQLAIEWAFNQNGVTCTLVGARNAAQAAANCSVLEKQCFSADDFIEIDKIVNTIIK